MRNVVDGLLVNLSGVHLGIAVVITEGPHFKKPLNSKFASAFYLEPKPDTNGLNNGRLPHFVRNDGCF